MTPLAGRTAVVTGGATLIGNGVVRRLHQAGAKVAVADIDEQGGRRIASGLGDGSCSRRPTSATTSRSSGWSTPPPSASAGSTSSSTSPPRTSTRALPPHALIGSSLWMSTSLRP